MLPIDNIFAVFNTKMGASHGDLFVPKIGVLDSGFMKSPLSLEHLPFGDNCVRHPLAMLWCLAPIYGAMENVNF